MSMAMTTTFVSRLSHRLGLVLLPLYVCHSKNDKKLTLLNDGLRHLKFNCVVVHYFSYKASDLIAYLQTIRESQRKFAGIAWYAYGIAFRKQAANDKSISCAQRDTQLYLEKFIDLAKTSCHMCGSADHFVNSCPIAPRRSSQPPPSQTNNACRNYNRKFPCAITPCPFKHRCNRPGCDGHHTVVDHDEKSAALNHSKRSRRWLSKR